MKKLSPLYLLFLLVPFLTGCEAVKGIFKTGFWAGIITVFLVVAFIIYIINRIRR